MSERPDIHAFPADNLGAFLRAMEDPEGKGQLSEAQERHIAGIEARLADAQTADRSTKRRPG